MGWLWKGTGAGTLKLINRVIVDRDPCWYHFSGSCGCCGEEHLLCCFRWLHWTQCHAHRCVENVHMRVHLRLSTGVVLEGHVKLLQLAI